MALAGPLLSPDAGLGLLLASGFALLGALLAWLMIPARAAAAERSMAASIPAG